MHEFHHLELNLTLSKETQDLEDLVNYSRAHASISGVEHPIHVVIRSPFLAMRYPKTATEVKCLGWLCHTHTDSKLSQIRRIQMKFNNDQEFTQAWNALEFVGLPISQHAVGGSAPTPTLTPIPPSSSPMASIFSPSSASSSRTGIDTPIQEPSRALSSSAHLPFSTPFKPEFKVPARPKSSVSEERPLHSHSGRASAPASTVTSTLSFPNSMFPEAMMQLPSIYVSQLEREVSMPPLSIAMPFNTYQAQSRRMSYPVLQSSGQNDATVLSNRPMAHFVSHVEAQHKTTSGQIQNEDRLLTTSPFFAMNDPSNLTTGSPSPLLSSYVPVTYTTISTDDTRHGSVPGSQERKSLASRDASGYMATSPSELNHTRQNIGKDSLIPDSQAPVSAMEIFDNLRNNVLPPKRELPFPRPRETPRSASADLPPLPKPTPLQRAGSTIKPTKSISEVSATLAPKPARKRVAQRKGPVAIVVEADVPEVVEQLPANESPILNVKDTSKTLAGESKEEQIPPLAAKSATASSQPKSAGSGLQPKTTTAKKRATPARPASASKRAKMVDHGTQTQTLSGRDHTVGLPTSAGNRASSPVVVASPPLVSPPETYLSMIDNYVSQQKARPAPKDLWQTPGYAEANREQRHLLINDFITECLESEEFRQLCEDVGAEWRKIGLGM
jgi:hypothetical protein